MLVACRLACLSALEGPLCRGRPERAIPRRVWLRELVSFGCRRTVPPTASQQTPATLPLARSLEASGGRGFRWRVLNQRQQRDVRTGTPRQENLVRDIGQWGSPNPGAHLAASGGRDARGVQLIPATIHRCFRCGGILPTPGVCVLVRSANYSKVRTDSKQEGNSVHLQSGEKAAFDFKPEGEIYSEGGKVLRVWHRAKPG